MNFEQALRKFGADLADVPERAIFATALEFQGVASQRTRVDTGRARGNWHVSKGAPDLSVEEGRTQGKVLTQGEGDTFLTNNVHYVEYLEVGTPYIEGANILGVVQAEFSAVAEENLNQILRDRGLS